MEVKVVNNLEDALKVIEQLNKVIASKNDLLTEKENKINELTNSNSKLASDLEVAKVSLVNGTKKANIIAGSDEDINIADFGITIF